MNCPWSQLCLKQQAPSEFKIENQLPLCFSWANDNQLARHCMYIVFTTQYLSLDPSLACFHCGSMASDCSQIDYVQHNYILMSYI